MKRVLRVAGGIIFVLLVVCMVWFWVMYRHEIHTLNSVKEREPGVYTMTYEGDYGFDEFLKTGASSDADIETFVTNRLLKGLPIKIESTEVGCTAFVTKNEEGEALYARNFDFNYAPFVQVFTNPDNGYASVSTVNLTFLGYDRENLPTAGLDIDNCLIIAAPYLPFDGMNEKGVCIALLAVPETDCDIDPEKITLNTTTAIRLVLDKAANVDEAVELLRQYNIYFSGDIGCHFLIADASGRSVLVEYYEGAVQVVEPDKDYQIASNFIAYNGVNIGEGATEFERYDKVEHALTEKNGIVSMDECADILNQVGVIGKDGTDKLQWSVVYNLSEQSGRIWPHRSSEAGWDFKIPANDHPAQ